MHTEPKISEDDDNDQTQKQQKIIKQAHIKLQSVWLKRWNNRWLELTRKYLKYYKYDSGSNTKDDLQRGRIHLDVVSIVRMSDLESSGVDLGTIIEVHTPKRIFCIGNLSPDEARNWIDTIIEAKTGVKWNNDLLLQDPANEKTKRNSKLKRNMNAKAMLSNTRASQQDGKGPQQKMTKTAPPQMPIKLSQQDVSSSEVSSDEKQNKQKKNQITET